MSTSLENTESIPLSLPQLQEKNRVLGQQLVEIIQKMFGDSELVDELGRLLISNPGFKLSTILSVSLTKDGPQPILLFNSTDTVRGASMSGAMQYPVICETSEEQKGLDNEK